MCRSVLTIPAEQSWNSAALGLGGNIGDPVQAMARALQALDARDDCTVISVSRLYRTPPWGKTDQADFFNSCALVRTSLPPEDLLSVCLDLERAMKRVRLERWGPRTLDIDILTYEGVQMQTETLVLPHPRMLERSFVLMPLADIAPDLEINSRPVDLWLSETDQTGILVADPDTTWWKTAVPGSD